MQNQTIIVGNLTADPELRYTANGTAVANFTIAHTPRVKEHGEWKDGPPLYLRCALWRQYAENAAETLRRGMQVIAAGQLTQRTFEAKDGTQRTVTELTVDDIGPTLRFATAKVERVQRSTVSACGGQQVAETDQLGDEEVPF